MFEILRPIKKPRSRDNLMASLFFISVVFLGCATKQERRKKMKRPMLRINNTIVFDSRDGKFQTRFEAKFFLPII